MIVCRHHKATYPRHSPEPDDMCWGHLEKVQRETSTDVCDPYWVTIEWGEPYNPIPVSTEGEK